MKRTVSVPHAARGLARASVTLKEAVIHAVLTKEQIRKRALRREVLFWDDWLASRGAQWQKDFEARLDPEASLRETEVVRAIDQLSLPRVNILDVGAGPLTFLSGSHPGSELDITAVDPLGQQYQGLLRKHGLVPPVVTQACGGENLLDWFEPNSFEVTYARNSLDHAIDAPLAVLSMFEVTKPGGWVILRHHPNEGETRHYRDLHRWNFQANERTVLLSSRELTVDLSKLFGHRAKIEWRQETERGEDGTTEWIIFAMQRFTG